MVKGSRVRVNERCAWEWRRGQLGTVVEVTEGAAYVLLDEEGDRRPPSGPFFGGEPDEPWSAKFECYSLTVVE